ncbi:hypothetical protein I553_1619 [Mycobacterium xenopi 4042]|uniref:Uncharacterized protein n=1 Tax=Mycobacterium xenopi 4042 TaxID=1299334 RepID=X8CFX9_MYCXE|nr:hypothetical protein I553_1619 [Mycobacterium xenopi 4042]
MRRHGAASRDATRTAVGPSTAAMNRTAAPSSIPTWTVSRSRSLSARITGVAARPMSIRLKMANATLVNAGRTVGLRHRVLPDESTVGQHRQQPVRGRRRHTQITGGFTQPDFGLLAEEQQQFQCLVDRLDRILGRNGVSATLPLFLHARNATCASVRAS